MSDPGTSDRGTAPRPFVFVVMPFDKAFDDVYEFGIKGAAEDVGAYAERVIEQLFDGSILDRVVNQISKADVIIADMTGRNPNVYYEVGYAHALDKVTVLITQSVKMRYLPVMAMPEADRVRTGFGEQHRLEATVPAMPAGAVETLPVVLEFAGSDNVIDVCLRLFLPERPRDFPFRVRWT